MLKTLTMSQIRCPVGFSEEINAVFHIKKSQNYPENDKKPKIFHFQCFYQIYVKSLPDFVDRNVGNVHQDRTSLSGSL